MLARYVGIIWLCLIAAPAWALCAGDSYLDRLSPQDRIRLDHLAADIPFGEGTRWMATRGDDVLTLIGTMHIHDPRLTDAMAGLHDTIKGADILLVEATEAEEAALHAQMTQDPQMLLLPDGQTLPELLDADTWDQLVVAARAMNIPPFLLSKFQPWYVMMSLSIPPCAMRDIAAGKRGLDHMIMQTARDNGVPIAAIEPYDTIFTVFQKGDLSQQIATLRASLLPVDDRRALFAALLDGYFAGQIGQIMALEQIAAERSLGLSAAQARIMADQNAQALLYDRNIAWIDVINEMAKTHDTIVLAVGAAHFPAHQGVLMLLQNDGWTITPF